MDGISVKRLAWVWAGQGDDCGIRGAHYLVCPTNEHYKRVPNSCGRRDCPEHWRDWLGDEAMAIHERFRYFFSQSHYRFWQHCVVSLERKAKLPLTESERRSELRRVYRALEKVGIKGGVVVAHGKRAHTVQDAHTCDDGAHYHCVGVGWINYDKCKKLYEETGILVKSLGNKRWKYVYGCAEYVLSHCVQPCIELVDVNDFETTTNLYLSCNPYGEVKPLHCATWWGCMAYNKLKIPEDSGLEPEIYCKMCDKMYPKHQWSVAVGVNEPPDGLPEWGNISDIRYNEIVPIADMWKIVRR